MSISIFPDATTGEPVVSVNGTPRFRFSANGDLVLLNAAAKVIGGVPLLPAGAFQLFQLKTAPAGWIAGDGSTIGAPGSGAARANNDTSDLFTAWWAAYTDAQLPLLTVTGAASSRGASAAEDWAAGKRLTVFDVRDRVGRASGSVQPNGTKLEATEMVVPYGSGGTTGVMTADAVNSIVNSDGSVPRSFNYSTWGMSLNAAATLYFTKVRVASVGMLGCYKL